MTNTYPIYATAIKGCGQDTFLQFVEHNSNGDFKAIPLRKIHRIDFNRPYFIIWVLDIE